MKREYPNRPIVAVGVVIRHGDRIVLIRRAQEPSSGRWTFPGGAVRLGETLSQAAEREAQEETGLQVSVGDVVAGVDTIERDAEGRIRYHYVIVDVEASPVGGELAPGTDATDARWVGLAELDGLDVTEKAEKLARKLLAEHLHDG